MDYKEKYEMALERAKCLYSQHEVEWRDKDIEYIFPELKKSEDERIRKELITHCRNTRCVTEEGAERIAKWIAWLEKQGEKPADKKDPKKVESQQAEIQKWSEEDENNFTDTCVAIRKFYHRNNGAQDLIDWLQSLKEIMKGEKA